MAEKPTQSSPNPVSTRSEGPLARRPGTTIGPRENAVATLRALVLIDLVPLKEPRVDPEFGRMGSFERAVESLRYNLSLVEYRLGRNGWIRAWATTTLRILIFILLPLTGALIVLGLFVPAAAAIAAILGFVEAATKSLLLATIYCVLTLIIVAAVISAVAVVVRYNRLRRE